MYNFDKIIPRRNTNSLKWDTAARDEILPMWVADMDFQTAPAIIEALIRRAQHGIFGYVKPPEAYYNAIINWFERRHRFSIQKEWILYTTGVVPALSAVIKALTVPGQLVIVQTPVYNCFFSSIHNNGCEITTNELVLKDGVYRINFDDLEKKTSHPNAKLLLLCSPHNPAGRVWTEDELNHLGEICIRNQVIIVSDEIHCDLVFPGHRHISFASISSDFLQNSVTCTAPSKTFNLAGLHAANIIASNEKIRHKIEKALNINEASIINAFAVEAVIAAYNEGEAWLEELIKYMYDNYLFVKEFIKTELPFAKVYPLEATYLAWVDFSALGQSSREITTNLMNKENLWLNAGSMYGDNGEGFVRINMACPRSLLALGLKKIKNQYNSYL